MSVPPVIPCYPPQRTRNARAYARELRSRFLWAPLSPARKPRRDWRRWGAFIHVL
jgi:hypothetical protein